MLHGVTGMKLQPGDAPAMGGGFARCSRLVGMTGAGAFLETICRGGSKALFLGEGSATAPFIAYGHTS